MTVATTTNSRSAFRERGFRTEIESLQEEVRELYRQDSVPWVIGYSGGKDSTAVLQLVWTSLQGMPEAERTKPVHVISTDTLVENPVVASWVNHSLVQMESAAREQRLPIHPHRLTPAVQDTFWVNLIGKGYPAPRHKFRWCTERMKIKPSNNFIRTMVQQAGEVILVLGTRKAESARRAATMEKHEKYRVRDRLSPNASLANCLIYSPVEDWTNDDIWLYLMQQKNPWGYSNRDLLTMYQGATADGECPLVVDTTTPSCGNSRFGCWVCTMVEQDRSMAAMIQNDVEKEWMLPLMELRNELDLTDDRDRRDFRRMSGRVQLFHDAPIHGPYTQEWRERWLEKLLQAQSVVRETGPEEVRDIELITMDELREIRRIWIVEKHEIEDSLPRIYKAATGEDYPDVAFDDGQVFSADAIATLRDVCGDDRMHFEMLRELLEVERQFRTMARRKGLFNALEKSLKRHFYEDREDATEWARRRRDIEEELRSAIDVEPFGVADKTAACNAGGAA